MKKLLVVALVVLVSGCSITTTTNVKNGVYCIDGVVFMMADGQLLRGEDDDGNAMKCNMIK